MASHANKVTPPGVSDQDVRCATTARVPVLISGGTPDGRESVALWIHEHGSSGEQPFDSLHGSASDLAEALTTLIPTAGTLYLDGIDHLLPEQQRLLSDALEGTPRRRVIVGTDVDLVAAMKHGAFCPTLYYRLNTLHIVISS